MALRAANSDESVRGAGLPACRRLSSRRAGRKLGGGQGGAGPTNAFSMERKDVNELAQPCSRGPKSDGAAEQSAAPIQRYSGMIG